MLGCQLHLLRIISYEIEIILYLQRRKITIVVHRIRYNLDFLTHRWLIMIIGCTGFSIRDPKV